MTKRLIRLGEALVAVGAFSAAGAAVAGHWLGAPLYAALAVLVVVGGLPTSLATTPERPATNRGPCDETQPSGAPTITTVVRVGSEPPEVRNAAIALAAQSGPTIVVATGEPSVDDGLDSPGVAIFRSGTIEDALHAAAEEITTDAVLIVSGRAVPVPAACARAARWLDEEIGWVTGTAAATLNDDGYLDDRAAKVAERLRSRARSVGLDVWEPDATLIRTDLLRDVPVEPGRPWGRWLRRQRTRATTGVTVPEPLALRFAPVAEGAFWPDTTARQRAAVADVADAVRTARGRARWAAAAVLVNELFAWRFILAALTVLPMLGSRQAGWYVGPVALTVALATLALARWIASCRSLGVGVRPVADAIALVHRVPGSLTAVGPALTARLRPRRLPLPARPLAWTALLFTAVSGARLVDRTARGPASVLSIAASLSFLALLWAFAVRAFLRRNWERTSFRVPVDVPVRLDGDEVRTVDASPRGLSVVVPSRAIQTGDRVEVAIALADGSEIRVAAVAAGVRERSGVRVAGLSLAMDSQTTRRWLAHVLDAAVGAGPHGTGRARAVAPHAIAPGDRRAWVRWVDRLAIAAGAAVSLAVLGSLVLVLSGYDTLVIRSGSMVPTFAVGDVVVDQPRPASAFVPGDVVTVESSTPGDDSLTHRIRSIRADGDRLVFTTRGDANAHLETWTVDRDQMLGHPRWHVPWIGRPAVALRDGTLGELCIGAGLLLFLGTLARWLWTRPAPTRHRVAG